MPGYVWVVSNGQGAWRPINGIYAWDDTVTTPVWRSIRNAYAWDDTDTTPVWRNIFSSGTFAPTLRDPSTNAVFSNRSVGLAIELYRGSNVFGQTKITPLTTLEHLQLQLQLHHFRQIFPT